MAKLPPINLNNDNSAQPVVVTGYDDGNGNITRGMPAGGGGGGGDASAANQTLQLTQATTTNTNLGPVTETAPTTDTASSGLNGRLQRLAQRITSLIALLPTALGAGGGLKVDGSGTALPVSGAVSATIATAPALVASEAHIGEVSGNGRPITVTFTRPANGTAYSQYDNVGVALAITGATNATPIVVTCDTHGLADGDPVTIASVGGNTAANVSCFAKVTGYSTVTFALYSDKALATPIAGNGNYTSGGTVARLFRIPGAFRKAGGNAYLTKVSCTTNNAAWATQHQLWFYNAPVPAILDNLEKTALWANTAQRMGPITMPAFAKPSTNSDCAISLSVPGDGVSSLILGVHNGETPVDVDLYFMVSLPLATPGTPASAQVFTYKFFFDAN